jgi:SAM-dependent methyltransferase
MNLSFVSALACPRDGSYPLALEIDQLQANDVQTGVLTCPACRSAYAITDGIPDLSELGDDPDELSAKRDEICARDVETQVYEAQFGTYQNAAESSALLRRLDLGASHRVLELGCGTGRMTRHLIKESAEFVGVDFSMSSLRELRGRMSGYPNINLVCADVNHLPLRGQGQFDRIVSSQLLEHLPSERLRRDLWQTCSQLLANCGRAIVTVYNYSWTKRRRGFSKEGLHSSGIFYHCYDARELVAEVSPWLRVQEICGVLNRMTPLRVLERIGRVGAAADGFLSRTRMSRATGHLLLVVCVPRTPMIRSQSTSRVKTARLTR